MSPPTYCMDLPEDVMMMVLNKATAGDEQAIRSSLRMVSKRWLKVVDSTVNAHALSFNSLPDLKWQGQLLQRLVQLTELHADLQAGLMDTRSHGIMLSSIVQAARRLENLHVALRLVRTLPLIADTSDMKPDLTAQLQALTTLHTLSLQSDGRVAAGLDILEAAVQNVRSLRVLRVRFAMGTAGLLGLAAHLQQNQAICSLDLQGTAINDEGAKILASGLARNSTLRELNLSHNTLGAGGAQAIADVLSGNAALVGLRLDFNSIGDGTREIGHALQHNSALQVLSLQCNGMGPRGLAHIANGLARNSSLLSLDLAGNVIQEEGALVLGAVLGVNSSLTNLCLCDCKLQDEGVRGLLRQPGSACSIRSLDLQRNQISTHGASAIAAALAGFPTARGARLHPSCFSHLDLSHNPLGDIGISLLCQGLCEAVSLRSLILANCDIGVAGAEAIAACLECMSLECLNVNRNSVADTGACALGLAAQKQCTLQELHVTSNGIKTRGSLAVAVALKSVQSMILVDLRGNSAAISSTKIDYMLQSCPQEVQCLY